MVVLPFYYLSISVLLPFYYDAYMMRLCFSYVRSLKRGLPTGLVFSEGFSEVGVHDDGYGAVVDEAHLHVGAEGAGLYLFAK